jgi:hypothetical protein
VGAKPEAIDATAFDFKLRLDTEENSITGSGQEPDTATKYANVRVNFDQQALEWLSDLGFIDQSQARSTREMQSQKRAALKRAWEFFDERVRNWNPNGPFPDFDEDWEATLADAQGGAKFIKRNEMREIRGETCAKYGYDGTNWLKRGPRRKSSQNGAMTR